MNLETVPALADLGPGGVEDWRLWLFVQPSFDPASNPLKLGRIGLASTRREQHVQSAWNKFFRVGCPFPEPLALFYRLLLLAMAAKEGGQRQPVLNTL